MVEGRGVIEGKGGDVVGLVGMKKSVMRWFVWALAVIFLFYEFIVRVFPSAMAAEIRGAYGIDATMFGSLSAFFFYAYAPMQLPIGVLMDRFGSRSLLTLSSLFCGIGAVVFGLATTLGGAQVGRFVMGIGSSVTFVGMVYVCSHWFPKNKLALLVGIGNSIGMLGAAWGVGPLNAVVEMFEWHTTVFGLGLIGFLLAIVIFICIRNEPHHTRGHHPDAAETLKSSCGMFGRVAGNWKTWVNGIAALFFYMPTGAFAGLWAVSYLEKVFHLDHQLAGFAVSLIFIGWICGGPVLGWFSDRLKNRKWVVVISCLLTGAFLVPIIYDPHLSIPTIYTYMFLVGFFSSGQLLNFSKAVEFNGREMKGSSIAMTNFIVAAGTAAVQPLIGYLMDVFWTGGKDGAIRVYDVATYQKALTVLPVMLAIALLLNLFLKDTKLLKDADLDTP